MAAESLGGLVLGLVPGLPYLLAGQFKGICLLWLAWLVLACTGVFLYGLPSGYTLMGLAAAVHAWLMFKHLALQVLEGLGERVTVLLFLALALVAGYVWMPRLLIPGLACVRSNMAIPYQHIRNGDALLVRRAPHDLKRGMIVAFRATTVWVPRGGPVRRRRDTRSLGQIIGLPGEEVGIRKDGFVVNGQALDIERYPVPRWLRGRDLTLRLTGRQYFVSCDYIVLGAVGVVAGMVPQICVASRDAIESQAFMLWWPLSRRGSLRVD